MLLPYSGDRQFEHFGNQGRPHTTRSYASDRSGTKSYHFNSLGFRGEEFDPDAAMKVFVCGASYAFGTGLDWEETWGYQLKLKLARELRLHSTQINLLNFSQSLASAGYITRTIISQCASVRPDLVVAHYSAMNRSEFFFDGSAASVMPVPFPWYKRWRTLRPGWRKRLSRWFPALRNRAEANHFLLAWNHYNQLFTAETGLVNTLTNILLLQYFCRAHGITFLISWVEHKTLHEKRFLENAAISPLIRLVDAEHFCPFSVGDSELKTDVAADNIHPGVYSNEVFAERLFQVYKRLPRREAISR